MSLHSREREGAAARSTQPLTNFRRLDTGLTCVGCPDTTFFLSSWVKASARARHVAGVYKWICQRARAKRLPGVYKWTCQTLHPKSIQKKEKEKKLYSTSAVSRLHQYGKHQFFQQSAYQATSISLLRQSCRLSRHTRPAFLLPLLLNGVYMREEILALERPRTKTHTNKKETRKKKREENARGRPTSRTAPHPRSQTNNTKGFGCDTCPLRIPVRAERRGGERQQAQQLTLTAQTHASRSTLRDHNREIHHNFFLQAHQQADTAKTWYSIQA